MKNYKEIEAKERDEFYELMMSTPDAPVVSYEDYLKALEVVRAYAVFLEKEKHSHFMRMRAVRTMKSLCEEIIDRCRNMGRQQRMEAAINDILIPEFKAMGIEYWDAKVFDLSKLSMRKLRGTKGFGTMSEQILNDIANDARINIPE